MAGPRYADWAHKRFEGDPALAAQHLPYARKLLGYLAQQRANGGQASEITRTLKDGTVVRAEFIGEQPRVTITARSNRELAPLDVLDGFVVSPGGVGGPTDYTEVVLEPAGADEWRVGFYSIATVPLAYPAKYLTYAPLFPDGLKTWGNVDWRNTKETRLVSWDGSPTRYFDSGGSTSTKVYFKGALLVDLASYLPALGLTSNGAWVTGAALAGGDALHLLVVLSRYVNTPSFQQYDTVLKLPLRQAVGTKPVSRMELAPRLVPAVSALNPAADITVLLDRPLPANEQDNLHPWCFNQSATQARCLRTEGVAYVHELVLDLAADGGSASVSRVSEAWPVVTTTNTVNRTLRALRVVGSFQAKRVLSGDSAVRSEAGTISFYRGYDVNYPEDEEYELDYVVASTSTTVESGSGKLRLAVDYRDDVPVYAFALPPDTSESASFSSTRSGSYSDAVSASVDGSSPPKLTAFTTSGAHHEESTSTETRSKNGRTLGLETDWLTVTASTTQTDSKSHSYLWDETWANSCTLTSALPAPWGVWGLDFNRAGLTETQTVSSTDSTTATDAGLLYLHHLDLRYRWLVHSTQNIVTDTGVTGGTDYERSASGTLDPAGVSDTQWAGPLNGGFVDSTLGAPYGALNTVAASASDANVTACSSTVVSTFDRTEDYRLRTTLGGALIVETPLYSTETHTSTPQPDVVPFRRFGDVLRAATSGSARRDGRTVSQLFATSPTADVTDTVGSGSSSGAQSNFSGQQLALDGGSWQTYHDHYAWACKADPIGTGPVYAHGIGRFAAAAITASAFDLPTLTGYAASPPVFFPISVLTPTAR